MITKKGYTLVEVLVAFVIFAVGIIGVTKLMLNVMYSTKDTKSSIDAMNIATQQIEILKNIPYGYLDVDDNVSVNTSFGLDPPHLCPDVDDQSCYEITSSSGIKYYWGWNVANATNTAGATARTVNVTVRWYDKTENRNKKVTYFFIKDYNLVRE